MLSCWGHFQACLEDEPSVKQRMQVILEQREAQPLGFIGIFGTLAKKKVPVQREKPRNKAAEMVNKTKIREV